MADCSEELPVRISAQSKSKKANENQSWVKFNAASYNAEAGQRLSWHKNSLEDAVVRSIGQKRLHDGNVKTELGD